MAPSRTLLVLGPCTPRRFAELTVGASESACEAVRCDESEERGLDHRSIHAIVVPAAWRDAEPTVLELRGRESHGSIPILALAERIDDLAFGNVFNWGADDLVHTRIPRALVRRLRALPRRAEPTGEKKLQKQALVADPDRLRRIVLGRVLQRTGYSVVFATNTEDALSFACQPEVNLVVSSSELDSDPALVRAARERGSRATWVVRCAPRDQGTWRESLLELERVGCTDAFAPPENVLFVANEIEHTERTNQRASARLLYGTTVAFRSVGQEDEDFGYAYNISAEGLYVRTISPPDVDRVWLELCPPRSERRVRLTGRVVWRRRFGHDQGATVPCGFGVQIVDGAREDLELWAKGYAAFASDVG